MEGIYREMVEVEARVLAAQRDGGDGAICDGHIEHSVDDEAKLVKLMDALAALCAC